MVHDLYAILAFVCVLIISILEGKTLLVQYTSIHKKSFTNLYFFSILFCLVDTIWGICASRIFSRVCLIVFSYAFHLGATFTTYYWFRFNLKFMDNKATNDILLKIFSDIILTVAVILIISNIFTEKVFYISEDCGYYVNTLRNLLFILQYLLFITMFLVSFISRMYEKKDKDKKEIISISLSYSIIPLICGIFQLIYPDMPVYSLGFMFSCLILYIFVLTSENEHLVAKELSNKVNMEYQKILQRNYSIISSLAGNYDYVCLVNDKENTIQNISVSGIFADFIQKSDEFVKKEDFDEMLRTIIPEDKIKDFIKNVNRGIISKKVGNGERVSIEFETFYNNCNDHYRISIASDKDNSNNCLFGFKNIESEFIMRQEIEKQKDYITNLEAQTEMAVLMASIDGLTGLLNKLSFIEKVERYLAENSSKNCALIFFDMDHFKSINDVFGHEKGDQALKEMATKLKSLFRSNELIARMGGDEFCIFLPDIAYEIVEKRIFIMNEKLKAVYEDENATIKTSASIGCVYCKKKDLSYVDMHKMADTAMYQVKERGRDGNQIIIV